MQPEYNDVHFNLCCTQMHHIKIKKNTKKHYIKGRNCCHGNSRALMVLAVNSESLQRKTLLISMHYYLANVSSLISTYLACSVTHLPGLSRTLFLNTSRSPDRHSTYLFYLFTTRLSSCSWNWIRFKPNVELFESGLSFP